MARDWFGRKTDNSDIAGLDGYYDQPGGWRLWVRRIIGVLAILALLAAFIWAATWVYGSVTDDTVDGGEESGQVTSPGDDSIDTGTTTGDGTTGGEGTDGAAGSNSSNGGSTSGTDSTTTDGTGSTGSTGTGSGSGAEDTSMPRTGDDSGDTPTSTTDVLPATGG